MANPNVLKQLEKIASEMTKLSHHVKLYGGVDSSKAKKVLLELHHISNSCDLIANEAHKTKQKQLDVNKIKSALSALHHYEKSETRKQAFERACKVFALSDDESKILANTIFLKKQDS